VLIQATLGTSTLSVLCIDALFKCLVDVEDGFLQMGKQTMGFPAQALQCRADNKMYRIQV
jgi:hypothetical protein